MRDLLGALRWLSLFGVGLSLVVVPISFLLVVTTFVLRTGDGGLGDVIKLTLGVALLVLGGSGLILGGGFAILAKRALVAPVSPVGARRALLIASATVALGELIVAGALGSMSALGGALGSVVGLCAIFATGYAIVGAAAPVRVDRTVASGVAAVLLVASALLIVVVAIQPAPSPPVANVPTASATPGAQATQAPAAATPPPSPTNPTSTTSPPPTLAPLVTPAPSPTLIDTGVSADGWPIRLTRQWTESPVAGPDGTLYFLANASDGASIRKQILFAVDRAGHVKPGWPREGDAGSSFQWLTVGPEGDLYVEECMGAQGCQLHRFGPDGRESRGWPFVMRAAEVCSSSYCGIASLEIGSNGVAYGMLSPVEGRTRILAIDPSGVLRQGWPVDLRAGEVWWSDSAIAPDGTLFLGWGGEAANDTANVHAIAPDGTTRPGWPVSVPGFHGLAFGPNGTVITWSWVDDQGELCFAPRRTVYTVLDADGRTAPGWPRGSVGFASVPAVAADGTIYYVSATGKVYAHDRAGEIKPGWPYQIAGALHGVCRGSVGPSLTADGDILVLGDDIVLLGQDGRPRPGWPYHPGGSLVLPTDDLDGVSRPVLPVAAADGTIHAVVAGDASPRYRADVIALDARGQLKAGWPYSVTLDPSAGEFIGALALTANGRLLVSGWPLLVSLGPDGRLAN